MNKVISAFGLSMVMTLAATSVALADTTKNNATCQPQYGTGYNCVGQGRLIINKTVQQPNSGSYVDNITINDTKYGLDSTINFQLNVTNPGNATLSKVVVKDVLPKELEFVSGPGKYEAKTKTLTFELANLNPGETRTSTITTKVGKDQIAAGKVGCPTNFVEARADDQFSDDRAQVCIQNQVLGTTPAPITKGGLKVFPAPKPVKTPPTGPEAIALIGIIPSALAGLLLRRRAIN